MRFQESVERADRAARPMAAATAAKIVEDAPRAPAGSMPDVVRVAAPATAAAAAAAPPRRARPHS